MSLKVALLACLLPLPLLASEPEEKKSPPEKKERVDLQVDWSKVPPEKILSLIKQFEDDPLKAKTDGIAGLVLDFGEKSQDVFVEVNLSLHPYLARKGKNDDVLLAAFIIGNVRPQVVGKTKQKNHSLAGLKMLLAVYGRLLKDKQVDSIAEYDAWAKLDDKGLEEVIAKHTKAETKEEKK